MKKVHLFIVVFPFCFISCVPALVNPTEQRNFESKLDIINQDSRYSDFACEINYSDVGISCKLLSTKITNHAVNSNFILGQCFNVRNSAYQLYAYTDYYSALSSIGNISHTSNNGSAIGIVGSWDRLYVTDVPCFEGKKQVVEGFVLLKEFYSYCYLNKLDGCQVYKEALKRGDEYMHVFVIPIDGTQKLISTKDYSLIKKLKLSSSNNSENKYNSEISEKVSVPIKECSFSNIELNYSEKFYANSSNEVIINLEQIANKYNQLDLTKKYIFNLVLTTYVNDKKDEVSKKIEIDLSKYLKQDINFVCYQISNEENNQIYSPGINNKYFDAGEKVDFYLTLVNNSENYYISSSAFLSVSDPYLKIIGDNIRFDEIYPNKNKKSLKPITLFIDPNTPNNHETEIMVKIKDSGFDKVNFTAFPITIYNVGPVDFEKAIVDDDNLGGSQGDGDGVLEAGEIIELIIFIRNKGVVNLQNVKAKLTPSNSSRLHVNIQDDEQEYENIKSKTDRSIPADFDIKLNNSIGNSPVKLTFKLSIFGNTSSGAQYSWESDFELFVNAKDPKLSRLIKK